MPMGKEIAANLRVTRRHNFTAIFAANDQMAYGVWLVLYRRGMRVPEDISIVGYDDQPASACVTPPLTSINIPAADIGEAAARARLQLLSSQAAVLPTFLLSLTMREPVARYR